MSGAQAALEIASLSGSTLAAITGKTKYDEIDSELEIIQTTLRGSNRQFDSWVDAIEFYQRSFSAEPQPTHNEY